VRIRLDVEYSGVAIHRRSTTADASHQRRTALTTVTRATSAK
jgi:hypothetical protein